jgi:hypothetical protein
MLVDGSDELVALLGPATPAAREHPRGSSRADEGQAIAICVVGAGTADEGGFAVCRQRNGRALIRRSWRAGANELRDLLIEPLSCNLLSRSPSFQ